MKSIKTLFLAALVANSALLSSALAHQPTEGDSKALAGETAQLLFDALKGASVKPDCGMGTCEAEVKNVSCTKFKFKESGSTCSLDLKDDRGTWLKVQVIRRQATRLTNALIVADVVGCGMETCYGAASSILCRTLKNPDGGPDIAQCSIN